MKMETLLSIVEALGTNVFEGHNINQVSRLSKVDVATTFRALKEMEGGNGVLKEKKGNNVFYKLNLSNAATLKYCELSSIEKRKAFLLKNPKIFGKISEIKKLADAIILFGSLARGERKPGDIDLLLLFEKKPNIRKIEGMMEGGISPIYMEFKEFEGKIRSKNRVVMEILRDGIILSGEGRYWESIKNAGGSYE